MRPFQITEVCKQLRDAYPTSEALIKAAFLADFGEQEGLIRMWLSEGIPFAFREVPFLYETVRGWLGSRLEVHPKTITMIGSGRIGYSLSPRPQYGRPFGLQSDLDFVAISEQLFTKCSEAFHQWKNDVDVGQIAPKNARENSFWTENLSRVPKNISSGFIDEWKLPRRPRYPLVQNVAQTMWLLIEKLQRTAEGPRVRKASLRIYKDWRAFVEQLHLNFYMTVRSCR